MMSRETLARIGVFAVALGLTAAPLAFADSQDKEHKDGEHSQSDQTTMQNDATTGTNTGTDTNTDTDASSDPNEAGGAGMEAQDGTQAGEEPVPEEESDT